MVAAVDSDVGLTLVSFTSTELHEDTGVTSGVFDVGETVYLDADTSGTVTAGDTRLANAATQGFADGSSVGQRGTVRNVKVVGNSFTSCTEALTDEGEDTKFRS
jgi:hypothetical protein